MNRNEAMARDIKGLPIESPREQTKEPTDGK
jgi:hypothetical protein